MGIYQLNNVYRRRKINLVATLILTHQNTAHTGNTQYYT